MENPASWNETQKAINEAITEADEATREGICGYSTASRIYYKLKEKGLLKDD